MGIDAPNRNHLWARLLVGELLRLGAAHFTVAPGSRSTPLAHAVAALAPHACTVHFDERGAAFHALGCARATGRPAVVICSSGSAVANLFPAVVEARMARAPLVLLTADRPPELLDCGANQAIDQWKIFGGHAVWQAALPCPNPAVPAAYVPGIAAQAVRRALGPPGGPVHLNCAYREPLAPIATGECFTDELAALGGWAAGEAPRTRHFVAPPAPDAAARAALCAFVAGAKRGVLLVGQLERAAERAAAARLAEALGWPALADVASGLRLGNTAPPFVPHYDQLLLSERFRAAFQPDAVLHLGGAITSKRVNEHLAALRPNYALVAPHPERQDPAHQVTLRIESDIAACCGALLDGKDPAAGTAWGGDFAAWSAELAGALDAWLDAQPALTEMAVARIASRARPMGATLYLGSSMPIRDMDMYGDAAAAPGPVAANRGASGIDGNIACAAGHADGTGAPVVAVLGDLAALHDLNSLALLRGARAPVALVVVNNDGGGIFHFLPVAEHADHFERFFGTPHGMDFRQAAGQFGIDYAAPATAAELSQAIQRTLDAGGVALIEVRTLRDENIAAHRALQAALRDAMAQ